LVEPVRGWIVAVVVGLLMLTAFAPAALAETFTVDGVGDAPDAAIDGTCDSDGGAPVVCTLRAAIQEANDETFNAGADVIDFSAAFNRELADTIVLGSALPTISTEIDIDGGNCPLSALAPGPCVGVGYAAGPPTMLAFVVAADNVSIEGLAVTNAAIAIDVINSSTGFSAHNNWLGMNLGFGVGPNGVGIFVRPDSNGAVIGGETPAERNVIAANGTGLDIEGADDAQVEGNFIGLAPDGATVIPIGENIEITGTADGGGFEATGNTVGGLLGGQISTQPCDGRCNAIAGSPFNGIDLHGEGAQNEIPAGATTIQGNYIGLNALGTAAAGNATGIRVGDADQVTIGALDNLFARNHINGGASGISATGGADDLAIGSNTIGLDAPSGAGALSPPSSAGIDIESPADDPASVSANTIAMNAGVAISVAGNAAEIVANRIGRGTSNAELTGGDVGLRIGTGMAVTNNTVANTTAVGPAAVLIAGGADNVLTANAVLNSGSIGIRITAPSMGNVIGGDSGPDSNTITGSAGDAIEISGDGSDGNLLLRNLGVNDGLFIDLGADGLGNSGATGPNGGIQAPAITSAVSGVSATVQGTSAPGATVRLFEKGSAANGEIVGFLGSDVADGSGAWEVTYDPAIGGPFVGATQTDGTLGTSELDVEGVEFLDTEAPQTEITDGPKRKLKTRKRRKRVRFEFNASEPGSSFECSIDGAAFSSCSSPVSFKAKRGKHSFSVRATDEVGNEDSTPASYAFKVKRKRKK
jgi:CSLREA domain-containing protein